MFCSLDDFLRITVVDGIDVFTESCVPLCIDLLDFSQTSTRHKQPLTVNWARKKTGEAVSGKQS